MYIGCKYGNREQSYILCTVLVDQYSDGLDVGCTVMSILSFVCTDPLTLVLHNISEGAIIAVL